MKKTIEALLNSAPDLDNPIVQAMRADAPANATRRFLDCQVVLKGGYSMAGVLTTDDDFYNSGAMRLCAIAQTPDKKVLIADHRFTCDEIATVVVAKPMPDQHVQGVRRPLIIPGS